MKSEKERLKQWEEDVERDIQLELIFAEEKLKQIHAELVERDPHWMDEEYNAWMDEKIKKGEWPPKDE